MDGTENRPVYVVEGVDQVHELSEVAEGKVQCIRP